MLKLSRNTVILSLSACSIIILLVTCIGKKPTKEDPRGNYFVGAEKCMQCHKDIYDTYVKSNHFLASSPAAKNNIAGSFTTGSNTFNFSPTSKIVMEDRDSGFFQVAYENGKEVEAHRFDIVVGKKHAQTFLSWSKAAPYELPISYYTSVKGWATSPGYSPHKIDFSRSISADCFECHSSFVKTQLNGFSEELDKNSIVYGIDCERCHGPAINHVNYHDVYPEEKKGKYIVSPAALTRQQKLDMCAVCHSGNDKTKIFSRFDFRPGDTLSKFFYPRAEKNTSSFDVHGNQYELLSQSECFLKSGTLDCSSCHNPHTNSDAGLIDYSKKCISCHQKVDHETLKGEQYSINKISGNCIDCHMPSQPSQAITFNLQGQDTRSTYLLRTHKIAIYNTRGGETETLTKYVDKQRRSKK